jgi:hypothetical protein
MIYLPKSQPAPESLAKEKLKVTGDCGKEDVTKRLSEDFKDKCYICEQKNFGSVTVEHFIPHKDKSIDLKFDWNNLFLACYHCNNAKGKDFENILDCTKTKDVETKIKYEFLNSGFPKETAVITSLDLGSIQNKNTVKLLNLIYFGETDRKKLGAQQLRNEISKETGKLSNLLRLYFSSDGSIKDVEKEKLKMKIMLKLSRCSSFTAFKHWIIRDNLTYFQEFQDYLN